MARRNGPSCATSSGKAFRPTATNPSPLSSAENSPRSCSIASWGLSFPASTQAIRSGKALRIACVDAGNERPHEAIEQLRGEFSADESGDGFVAVGRNAFPEDVAHEGPFRRAINQRTHEKRGRTHGHGPEFAVDQDISRCAPRGLQQFLRNAEFRAKLAERRRPAETLRSQFQQEAVASYRADDPTGTRRGLDQLCVNPGFAQSIGADQAGDATADH